MPTILHYREQIPGHAAAPVEAHSDRTHRTDPTIYLPLTADHSNLDAARSFEKHKSKTLFSKTRAFDFDDTVEAINYKAYAEKTAQMERHADVQNEDTKRLAHDWRQDVGIVNKYKLCQTQSLDMFSEFQEMWNGRIEQTVTAQRQIELLEPTTRSLHSSSYLAGPGTCKFEKSEIGTGRNENNIKPAHTEWALITAFVPDEDVTIRFVVYYRKLDAVTEGDSF